MSAWPEIKTARQLVDQALVPCSEDLLARKAREHSIGRKLGRAIVFEPADVRRLLELLPCPSSSSNVESPTTGRYAGPSGASSLTKALALSTAGRPKKSSRSAQRISSGNPSTVIRLSERSRTPR